MDEGQPESPFARARLRGLVGWGVLGVGAGTGILGLADAMSFDDSGLVLLVGILTGHGVLLAWSLNTCARVGVPLRQFFRPLPHPWPWGAQLAGLVAGFLCSAGWGAFSQALWPSSEPAWPIVDPAGSRFPDATLAFAVVAVLVVAPLVEELAFRGVLLRILATRHRTATAVTLSAVAFALLHGRDAGGVVAIGVVAGVLAVRTGSLAPAVLGHFLHNGLVLVLATLIDDEPPTESVGYEVMLIGGVFYLVGALILHRLWRWAHLD